LSGTSVSDESVGSKGGATVAPPKSSFMLL
jgi:hypothetical protein